LSLVGDIAVSLGFKMDVKQLAVPLELAVQKFSQFNWVPRSTLPTLEFFDHWQTADGVVGGKVADVTRNSHSFTKVLRERLSDRVRKSADDVGEFFTAQGLWVAGKSMKDIDDLIAKECKSIWGPHREATPGARPVVPKTPFNDDAWHSARREAILRNITPAEQHPLDSTCRFKLLFAPNPSSGLSMATVYDFRTDTTRPARAEDRLLYHTAVPYVEFKPPDAIARAFDAFMESYFEWHLGHHGWPFVLLLFNFIKKNI